MKYHLPTGWPKNEAEEAEARKTEAMKKLFEAKERQRKHKEARGE